MIGNVPWSSWKIPIIIVRFSWNLNFLADFRKVINDMIYLLTAIGVSPCGSSTVHIYTQTIHRTTQNKQYIEQHKYFGRVWAVPRLGNIKLYENASSGSRGVPVRIDRQTCPKLFTIFQTCLKGCFPSTWRPRAGMERWASIHTLIFGTAWATELSALRSSRSLPQRKFLGTHFCLRLRTELIAV